MPLLKWVLDQWASEERQLVLAMDAMWLKQLFVVLSISIVYRGCAIPVAAGQFYHRVRKDLGNTPGWNCSFVYKKVFRPIG